MLLSVIIGIFAFLCFYFKCCCCISKCRARVIDRCYRRQRPQRVKFVKSSSTTIAKLQTIDDNHNQQEISDEIIEVQPSNIDHNDNGTKPQSITASPLQIVTPPIVSSVKKITADNQDSLISQTNTAIITPTTTAVNNYYA